MAYLLDANIFLTAQALHYSMDFCPAFWDWLVQSHAAGRVFSIAKVHTELLDADVKAWADQRGAAFFLSPDAGFSAAFSSLSRWATGPRYEPVAYSTFLQVADSYLVAQALAGGHTVVTHEVPSDSRKKIKVPDACAGVQVACVNPFEMLRAERARFRL